MAEAARQPLPIPQGTHLVLYDGLCGLCDGLIQFVLSRDRDRVFDFASLQSPIGRAVVMRSGRNPDELTSFYVVEHYRTAAARVLTKSRAALFVAGALGWPWKAACAIGVLPRAMLDWGYDLIARYRYQLFGRFDRCLLPRPEDRHRFVDF